MFLVTACWQSFLTGFNQGKQYAEWEPYIKLLTANNNQTPEQLFKSLQQAIKNSNGESESEFNSSLNNQTNDSGFSFDGSP